MLKKIIEWSINNKFFVILIAIVVIGIGIYSIEEIKIDAIPDLSDTQVIIYTNYPGQAAELVEQQVTYPITTAMMSVAKAKVVRGYSFFGVSMVYVIFKDGTDLYWARSRVLEYLNTIADKLPPDVKPSMGPDASGVGWVYEYALTSKSHDLSELRSMQDWYLRYQLESVPGVAEVASIGGYVRNYRVTVDPIKMRAYHISLQEVESAIKKSNNDVGGGTIEMGETEFMVRGIGYLKSLADFNKIPVGISTPVTSSNITSLINNQNESPPLNDDFNSATGTPVYLSQIATISIEPEARRGIVELNGKGETVGGIVIMRDKENAVATINAVKQKLAELKKGLPDDVKITTVYDRSSLINRSVDTLRDKLIEEGVIVCLICLLFLFHFRSSLVAIIMLPIAVLISFVVMNIQGLSANIMSLGGIAIAIGTMVDAAIIMIENAHKHIEEDNESGKSRWKIITESAVEVGPSLFFSLLVIAVSFLPIFTLQAQEGRMFKPLAFTKTYSMAAAALLSITLVPVLMGLLIRGKIPKEEKNPINRIMIKIYHPVLNFVLRFKKIILLSALILLGLTFIPFHKIGSEFMPSLWEGDLLYMPSSLPGISITKAAEVLQQTDKIIRTFPEVKTVFGKMGRAETSTDPAPLDMMETTIMLKPQSEWREGMTQEKLIQQMDRALQIPGLTNVWTMPIKNRIEMLSTGIKTPVGIKIAGPDLHVLDSLGRRIETIMHTVPGTASAYAERLFGGNYIDFTINREAAARYGLAVSDIENVVQTAIGGKDISEMIVGLQRYPISIRYPRELRDNIESLKNILVSSPLGAQIPLGQLGTFEFKKAPMLIRSEDSRPNDWVYVDVKGTDIGTYVKNAKEIVAKSFTLPTGYTLSWSGQFQSMQSANNRLKWIIPFTLFLIFVILYLNTKSLIKVAIIFLAVPFSLIGAFWILYLLHYNLSIAVWVGIIALAGLDAETGIIMLLYLDIAYIEMKKNGRMLNQEDLKEAIHHGAVKRIRPKMMTATAIIAGLLPIMWSTGSGADVMKRIAAPMVGGIITSVLLELLIYPIIYYLWKNRELKKQKLKQPVD
ncbi:MAG: CusA/CzcA family heavy metal efflux RND transporter [Bacteroidia bacterium]